MDLMLFFVRTSSFSKVERLWNVSKTSSIQVAVLLKLRFGQSEQKKANGTDESYSTGGLDIFKPS